MGTEIVLPKHWPIIIAACGKKAEKRFLEFFTAQIRNKNTRKAYLRAVCRFFDWCDQNGLGLIDIEPFHVAAYIELLAKQLAAPSIKQHLAAIRMLFDWLVTGQILEYNPASSVRGPRHVQKRGKSPVLTSEEARELLDSIPTDNIGGLRDRALIAVMLFSFARIGAVTAMKVEDYYYEGRRAFLRLSEKGGKLHKVPCHHTAQEYLDDYIAASGISEAAKTPLFRSLRSAHNITERSLLPTNAWHMVRRRTKAAGLDSPICNHSFRATGITVFLDNGGTIETAAEIASHESPRTTKLYDRTSDALSLDEIERIRL